MEKIKTYFIPGIDCGPMDGKYCVIIDKEDAERFGRYLTELGLTYRTEVDPETVESLGGDVEFHIYTTATLEQIDDIVGDCYEFDPSLNPELLLGREDE